MQIAALAELPATTFFGAEAFKVPLLAIACLALRQQEVWDDGDDDQLPCFLLLL